VLGVTKLFFPLDPEEQLTDHMQLQTTGASLRDTKYVLDDYITMYTGKERSRSIVHVLV
jgi:hypothetical protein